MCGIVGFIDDNINYDAVLIANKMGETLKTRGPDSKGNWADDNLGINLVHQRLAILDLSAAGHQPMTSKTERYVITYNGEVYNWQFIRDELEKKLGQINWCGHSDTEIILLAFEVYGIDQALDMFEGMFAIGVWDRQLETLYLIRDRIGEKPLYYGYFNGVFAFASELKAFRKHPKFTYKINKDAIAQLALHSCIPAPMSIFEDIYKLQPGEYLKLKYSRYKNRDLPDIKTYWNLSGYIEPSYTGSIEQAVDDLELMLTDIIKKQTVTDVPFGCFLSGGVDSSTVAAVMQKISKSQVHTFSMGFNNKNYDEAKYAAAVAKHLGTDHTEMYLTDNDAINLVPKLAYIYDEPFSDSSQIPTYFVSQLAKKHVTVSLSGDGGDELFAGYTRHTLAPVIYSKLQRFPGWQKSLLCKCLPLFNKIVLLSLGWLLNSKIYNLGDKLQKLENLLQANDFDGMYLCLTAHWLNCDKLIPGITRKNSLWFDNATIESQMRRIQYLDTKGYLPDDILVKVDRASMANSLEVRTPFLNHKLVKFAYSLPDSYKVNDKQSKLVLRKLLYRYVPKDLIERPKVGFAIPVHDWLRGALKEWAFDLLDERKLKQQGILNSKLINKTLNEHMNNNHNNGLYLWDILMFQQWFEYWESSIGN